MTTRRPGRLEAGRREELHRSAMQCALAGAVTGRVSLEQPGALFLGVPDRAVQQRRHHAVAPELGATIETDDRPHVGSTEIVELQSRRADDPAVVLSR